MSTSAFIDDGYTEPFYIKAVHGVHPEVRGKYRPVVPEERAAFLTAIKAAKDGPAAERRTAAILPKHLLEWSFDRPVSTANVLKLKWALYERLVSIVLYGIDGGDVDPQLSTDDKLAADERDQSAADSLAIYNDAILEADAKN